MDGAIIQCIQIRVDFFEKYYSVPSELEPEVTGFVARMKALGEQSTDAQDFEAKFAAQGLQEQMNSVLMRCRPKPYNMTEAEQAAAKEAAKEIFMEDRSRIAEEAAAEAADYAAVMGGEEIASLKRRAMVEAGVYDEYTRVSNAIDIAKDAGGLFKGLFKKKK